jgi:hypothetical protein
LYHIHFNPVAISAGAAGPAYIALLHPRAAALLQLAAELQPLFTCPMSYFILFNPIYSGAGAACPTYLALLPLLAAEQLLQ